MASTSVTISAPPPPPPAGDHYAGPMSEGPPSSCFTIFMDVVNTATQLVLGAVAFSALFFANLFNGNADLTQHIYLCVIGYIILMSQAIMAYNPHSSFVHNLKYPQKKIIHLTMQIIGSTLAIVGSIIRLNGVRNPLETAHGILGLTAMILTSMSLIGGILKLICNKLLDGPVARTLHGCVGALAVTVAFTALCTAFDDLYRAVMGDLNADLSIALAVFGLIGTLLMSFIHLTRRRCCDSDGDY